MPSRCWGHRGEASRIGVRAQVAGGQAVHPPGTTATQPSLSPLLPGRPSWLSQPSLGWPTANRKESTLPRGAFPKLVLG